MANYIIKLSEKGTTNAATILVDSQKASDEVTIGGNFNQIEVFKEADNSNDFISMFVTMSGV